MTLTPSRLLERLPSRVASYAAYAAVAAFGLILSGCAGTGSLEPAPAPGVSLAGVWKLNPAASDDPRKALESLAAKASSQSRQPGPQPVQGRGRRRGQGQGQGQGGQSGPAQDGTGGAQDPQYEGPGPRPDPLRYTPYPTLFASDLLRSEVLTIRQTAASVALDYGTSIRRFTPGEHSVVSVPGGVADQRTGWKGKEFIVDLRSQVGPDMTERYSLSPDKKQLIVKVHMSGSNLPNVNLTRVYESGSYSPRAFPTND